MITLSKFSNTIEYNLKTTVDSSGVTKLQTQLLQLQQQLQQMGTTQIISNDAAAKAIAQVEKVQQALKKSYNANIGMLDTKSFVKNLGGESLTSLQKGFSSAGVAGQQAFNNVLGTVTKLDTGIKSTSSMLDKLFNTMSNTVRWGVTSSIFNQFTQQIQNAVSYTKDLDDSLTQIMLVTDYSRENMNQYAKSANEAAKALGATTVDMTNATLVFSQAGYDLDTSSQIAELSTKLANASQQDTATTSDQIIAYMNAYGLDSDISSLQSALDSWAQVANVSAADVGELAEASQRAASSASTLGVSTDQLNAQIATIESVTKEAPEVIGNGLKTLYARFSDLEAGETLDDGVSLGDVTGALDKIGVQVLDGDGKMRGVGSIMEDLMDVWQSIDETQKAAIGQTLAGKYQMTRFMALMNRSDLYDQYKESSENAEGTLDEMNEKYVDSLEGRLAQLQASWEGIFNNLFSTDDFYGVLDVLIDIVDTTNEFVQAIGGVQGALSALLPLLTRVFSKQIGDSATKLLNNLKVNQTAKSNREEAYANLRQAGLQNVRDDSNAEIVDFAESALQNSQYMSQETQTEYNTILTKTVALKNEQIGLEDKLKTSLEAELAVQKLYNDSLEESDIAADGKSLTDAGRERLNTYKTYQKLSNSKSQLKKDADIFGSASKDLTGANSSASELKLTKNGTVDLRQKKKIQEFTDVLNSSVKALKSAEGNTKKLEEKITQLGDGFSKGSITLDDYKQGIEECVQELELFQSAASDNANPELIEKYQQELAGVKQEMEGVKQSQQGFLDNLDTTKALSNLAALAGAIGGLAFAWQSFQTLGSIWANTDLTDGEKLEQTIMNLVFSIPQLLSSVIELSTALKELGGLEGILTLLKSLGSDAISSIKNFIGNIISAVTGVESLTTTSSAGAAGMTAMAAGEEAAAAGAATLTASLGPVGIALAAIAAAAIAIPTVIGFFNQQEEERINAITEAADNAKSSISTLKDSVSSFDELYQKYQEGQATSDELKSAADSLNNTLDDQSLKTAAAAKNWDAYAESLQKAAEKKLKSDIGDVWDERDEHAQAANNAFARTSEEYISTYNAIQNGSSEVTSGVDEFFSKYGKDFSDLSFRKITGTVLSSQKLNDEEAYEQLSNFVDAYNSALDEINKLSEEEQEQLKKLVDNAKEQINNTDVQTKREDDESLGSSYAQLYKNDSDLAYTKGDTVDKYKSQVKKELAEKTGREVSDDLVNAFVSGMTETDTDLAAQQTKENAATSAKEIREKYLAQAKDTDDGGYDDKGLSDLFANLTDEQVIKLSASLDYDEIIANYKEIIQKVNSGEEDFDDILLEAKLKVNPLTQEDIDDSAYDAENFTADNGRAADLGMSAEDVANYTEALKSADTEQARNLRSIEDTVDAYKDQEQTLQTNIRKLEQKGKLTEDEQDELDDYQKKLKDVTSQEQAESKQLERLTNKAIESQKAVDVLCDSFENNAKVLRSAESSYQDITDTVNDMVPGIEGLLNIDMSDWTQDIKNAFVTDNLNDIEAALNGDEEALQRLRSEAANRIAVEIGLDDNEDLANEASDLVKYAQDILPSLEAGASIDDETFNQQLENMINNALAAGVSIDKIMNFISGLGIDAEVETVTKEFKGAVSAPSIAAETGNGITHYTSAGAYTEDFKGQISVPKVTLKKDSNGNALVHKTNTSKSSGGYSGRTGGSGSGSGSGGSGSGSGSGSSYTPQTKELIEDEADRYEKVQTKLDAIAEDYSKLTSEQDRLTGSKLADNLAKQNELLDKQITLYQEKLEIQKQEQAELQSELSGYGITFDSDGFMENYESTHKKLINAVNDAIKNYNAQTTEEAQDAAEKAIDAAQDRLDKFVTAYERYDELISSDIKSTIQSIEDAKDAIEDLHISAFKTQVQAADNIKDLQESLVDFNRAFNRGLNVSAFDKASDSIAKLGKYFDVTTGSATEYYDTLIAEQQKVLNDSSSSDAMKQYASAQISSLSAARQQALDGDLSLNSYGTGYLDMSMRNVSQIMEQIQQYEETGTSSIFGENSADLYEVAKQTYEQATELIDDYWSEIEDLHDDIMEQIDDISDAMDRRKEQYEAINDELEHQANIIELLRGEESYDELNSVLAAQQSNSQAELNTLIQQRDVWQDMLNSFGERTENNEEEWDTIVEKIKDATSDINSLIETSLENLQQQYTNTVNKITKSWATNALGTDVDWMNTQWELINRNADYYLDDTNKAYNIQKLQSKYLDLLDGSNDLATQKKITAQMSQQLDYLRDKTKLSEYDVQYANAQLEILQKQIALEDAQRNKSQMKLRRDTQGNYSYVYTADQDNVRSAESDLLDAQNNAYNLSKDQMKQTQADSLSALQDAQSTVNDIWNNANLTLEEKKARTQTILDSLREYLAGTAEQLSTSEVNIIQDFIGMCEMLTDENKAGLNDTYQQIVNGNKDAFDSIDTRWQTSITTWLGDLTQFDTDTKNVFDQLVENATNYQNQTDELAKVAKANFNQTAEVVKTCADETAKLATNTDDFIQQLKNMSGEVQNNESTMQKYIAQIQSADNAMRAFQEDVNNLNAKVTAKEQENANLNQKLQQSEAKVKELEAAAANSSSGSGSGGSSSAGSSSDVIAKRIANAIWYWGDWGNGMERKNKITSRYGSSMYDLVQSYFNGSPAYGYQWRDYSLGFERYDTGGYTGDWSDGEKSVNNGKLAFLHQKELVLNASDTENILTAVNTIRSITDGLKSNSFSSLIAALNTQAATPVSSTQDIEQNVHITAEFPNANTASEIESALMSLNERAVQYAFKTR